MDVRPLGSMVSGLASHPEVSGSTLGISKKDFILGTVFLMLLSLMGFDQMQIKR